MEAHMPTPYEAKFSELIRLVSEARSSQIESVVVASPHVLGDNYAELIQSLDRISEAGLSLAIVPPSERNLKPASRQV
jgi:DNA repair photolyase